MEPLSDRTPSIPRLMELERLQSLAQRFERNPDGAEAEARDFAGMAGSLGGVRPKANVAGDGHLWIAKFTSAKDTKPVELVEVATLKLAKKNADCTLPKRGLSLVTATVPLHRSAGLIAVAMHAFPTCRREVLWIGRTMKAASTRTLLM